MPPSIAANSSPHRYNHDAARCSRANPAGSSISPVLCASSASGERAIARPYPCDTPASSASVPRAWLLDEGRFRTGHLHLSGGQETEPLRTARKTVAALLLSPEAV